MILYRLHVMSLFGQQLEARMWTGFHQLRPATTPSRYYW